MRTPTALRASLLALTILTTGVAVAAAQTPPPEVPATPANVATFLGAWTVSATGSYGPTTMDVTLKNTDGKVTGQVTSQQGTQAISAISKSGASLVLRYAFDYNGMAINAIITLTPGEKQV